MKKPEEVYKVLKKKYTDEELADSFIFSIELPEEEQQEIREEFLRLRFERLKSMPDKEKTTKKRSTRRKRSKIR